MEEVQWRVSSLYVKDELCSRLIPLAAFFLFCFVHLQPSPYFSSAKPDKTTSLEGQVNLYCRRRKARKATDRLKMRLKIFKPITKRGDAQNTYTKFLLVFNLVVAEQIASCCYSVRSTDISGPSCSKTA